MKIPTSASDEGPDDKPQRTDAYIINPYHNKEYLTFQESLDLLNIITGELIADGNRT